jgi:ribonuclease P protein component
MNEKREAQDSRRSSKGQNRFTPGQRVCKRSEFKIIFDNGARVRGTFLSLWHLACPDKPARLGIVVAKKYEPKATQRNLWKRRIREIFRNHGREIAPGHALIVMVSKCGKIPTSLEMKAEMMRLFARAGLLRQA